MYLVGWIKTVTIFLFHIVPSYPQLIVQELKLSMVLDVTVAQSLLNTSKRMFLVGFDHY